MGVLIYSINYAFIHLFIGDTTTATSTTTTTTNNNNNNDNNNDKGVKKSPEVK